MKTNDQINNPLLSASNLKHEAIDFPKIKSVHFIPAVEFHIAEAKKIIASIRDNSAPPTFENTVEALETADEDLGIVTSVFYSLLNAEANDELNEIANELGPKTSAFSNDILLDDKLFSRIKTIYDQKDQLQLDTEASKLLEETYVNFTRNGALLKGSDKEKLRKIDEEKSRLGPAFHNHVLKATNSFELIIEDEGDLAGLPESSVSAAAHAAKEKGYRHAWLFNLDAPSFVPFLKYADNRELREKMYLAYSSRAFEDDFDNQDNVKKIVQLRNDRAQLLGYKSHADYVLKKRMAETPDQVFAFLKRIYEVARPAAEKDMRQVQEMADSLGGPPLLQPWDFAYYAEKLQQKLFDFDEEELRPYFKLENVVAGVFLHATKLYGLEFKPSDEYPVYHKDVKVYEVYDSNNKNEFMGLFYTDYFPRPTKKGGAWMTSFRDQGLIGGHLRRPHVSIVCNFTKPTPDKPSLLTFREVQTLFHEFGHALHMLLSKCRYTSLSGANVYWDFVELPSQVMENWTLEKESLDLFARHYESNEMIPADLTQKIKDSDRFLAGYYTLRQIHYGTLDMAWHTADPKNIRDVGEFERMALEDKVVMPMIPGTNISCSFSHIFAGGYSAGYYSYQWAQVLDADAFEYFQEKGLFNPEVANKFRTFILERGGTENPMDLYVKFRGRKPDPDALLRRSGLS